MKRIIGILCMMVVLSVLLLACKDSKKDSDDTSNPVNFPLQQVMEENISMMTITVDVYYETAVGYLFMYIKENHDMVSLKVNGNDIEIEGFMGFYYGDVDISPGETITYELMVDNKARNGSLKIPDMINVSFPEQFNLNADFSLSWTTASDPASFLVGLDIETDEDWIDDFQLLEGNKRSHNFSRSMYSGLSEEEIWYLVASVRAFDFDVKDEMVMMATVDSEKDYYFDDDYRITGNDQLQSGITKPRFLRHSR